MMCVYGARSTLTPNLCATPTAAGFGMFPVVGSIMRRTHP